MALMKRLSLIAVAVAAVVAIAGCAPSPRETQSVTVAVARFESVGLFYVAENQDMFLDNGLELTVREYETGVAALNAVAAGEADIAVGSSEYPLVGKAFEGASVSTVACIDRPVFIYLVGRKDKGIDGPSDLAGKRIGTTAGSIAQFYLGRFLELNNMTFEDITFVDLKSPEEWRQAIADGDVDAVVLAQPEASVVEGMLGGNATFFSVQESQPVYSLAISTNEWIAQNPDSVEAFLAALADAEEFVAAKPAETRTIIQERLDLDSGYMDLVETQNQFAVSLDQSLITAMEDEARWMIQNGITSEEGVPDFSNFVHTDGLERVKPEAVNIIR